MSTSASRIAFRMSSVQVEFQPVLELIAYEVS
jgi:hypothetical protein